MIKIPLDSKRRVIEKNIFPWSSCAPFVENSRGSLIHRPRSGATYNIHKHQHISVSFWCGMAVATHTNNLTFLPSPPDGKILCEKCEANAVKNGLPSADDLAGKHVHKGRTVAVVTCCPAHEGVTR